MSTYANTLLPGFTAVPAPAWYPMPTPTQPLAKVGANTSAEIAYGVQDDARRNIGNEGVSMHANVAVKSGKTREREREREMIWTVVVIMV